MTLSVLIDSELNGPSPPEPSRKTTASNVIDSSRAASVSDQREKSLTAVRFYLHKGELKKASDCLDDAFRLAHSTDTCKFWDRCIVFKAWLNYLAGKPTEAISVIVPLLSRPDTDPTMQAAAAAFVANTIAFLPPMTARLLQLTPEAQPRGPVSRMIGANPPSTETVSLFSRTAHLFPAQPQFEEPLDTLTDRSEAALRPTRTAFAYYYTARLGYALRGDPGSETDGLYANLAFLNELGPAYCWSLAERLRGTRNAAEIVRYFSCRGNIRDQATLLANLDPPYSTVIALDFSCSRGLGGHVELATLAASLVDPLWRALFASRAERYALLTDVVESGEFTLTPDPVGDALPPRLSIYRKLSRIDALLLAERPSESLSLIADALESATIHGLRASLASSLIRLAHAKYLLGEDGALGVLEQADDVGSHCDLWEEARMLTLTADIKVDTGDLKGCIDAWRQAAVIYDKLADLNGLRHACEELSKLCDEGPAVFYEELVKRISSLETLKTSDIPPLLLPMNLPGNVVRVDRTPKKRQRSSRISAGGLPMLSPWKPSLADVSP